MSSKYQLRESILALLERIEGSNGYSHILIDQEIRKKQFTPKDQALLTEVVYGTVQRKLTLDHYLDDYIDHRKKISPWVRMLLRMSVYQMCFLDRVPSHAIIHEAVEIAKKRGHKGIGSFVNGVLRNLQRNGVPDIKNLQPLDRRISIETSTPEWLVTRWLSMYGEKTTIDMCTENLTHKQMSVRIQSIKISREEAMEQLMQEGIKTEASRISDDGIIVLEGNVLNTALFQNGFLTVQDQGSMLVGSIMKVENGMHVLDCCSAPGGKTTHIAEKMNGTGTVFAYDIQKNKIHRLKKRAEQLELGNIHAEEGDARQLQKKHPHKSFERVLVDAPCSGLGVIRTKPDIKYQKEEADIQRLATIQKDILHHVAPLIKQDGYLIYSTCTVDKEENENVVQTFLHEHPEFMVDETFFSELPSALDGCQGITEWGVQIFPQTIGSDGFFLTRLKKATNI